MSYPGAPPPPPPPRFPLAFPGRDVGGFSDQSLENPKHRESHSQSENEPPSMRPRNFRVDQPNAGPLSPMNSPNLQRGTGSTRHIFYKTRPCLDFARGTCRNGDRCRYAHGYKDLQEPPTDWEQFSRKNHRGVDYGKRYYSGEEGLDGEKRTFLHERPMTSNAPRARQRESCAINIMIGSTSDNEQTEKRDASANSDAFQVKTSQSPIVGHCTHGMSAPLVRSSEVHVPGGRNEARLHVPVVNPCPARPLAAVSFSRAERDKKIAKLNSIDKIAGIYGDWIDDLSPPHDMPSEAEG